MFFNALCSLFLAGALVTLAPIEEVTEGEYVEVCIDLICTGSTLDCPLEVKVILEGSTKTGIVIVEAISILMNLIIICVLHNGLLQCIDVFSFNL